LSQFGGAFFSNSSRSSSSSQATATTTINKKNTGRAPYPQVTLIILFRTHEFLIPASGLSSPGVTVTSIDPSTVQFRLLNLVPISVGCWLEKGAKCKYINQFQFSFENARVGLHVITKKITMEGRRTKGYCESVSIIAAKQHPVVLAMTAPFPHPV
jgi:hypothetical protein